MSAIAIKLGGSVVRKGDVLQSRRTATTQLEVLGYSDAGSTLRVKDAQGRLRKLRAQTVKAGYVLG